MMASKYPAGTVTVRGTEVAIFTDDDGQWLAWIRGGAQKITAPTRDALKTELGKAIRATSADCSVPFLTVRNAGRDEETVRAGVATGIHSSSRNILVAWSDDGTKGQLGSLGNDKIMRGDTDPAEWLRIRRAYHEAARALYAFEEAHKISLREAVTTALRAAVGPG